MSVSGFLRTVMDTIDPNRENKPNNCSSGGTSILSTAKAGRPPTQMVAALQAQRQCAVDEMWCTEDQRSHSVTRTADACCFTMLPSAPVDPFCSSSFTAARLTFNLTARPSMHVSWRIRTKTMEISRTLERVCRDIVVRR